LIIHQFKSIDCPDANGRQPKHGEVMWTLKFPLDNGDTLLVDIGEKGRYHIAKMMAQDEADADGKCQCVCHKGIVGMPHPPGECCDECPKCGIELARPMFKHVRLCDGKGDERCLSETQP
jgi:hypothetical protein